MFQLKRLLILGLVLPLLWACAGCTPFLNWVDTTFSSAPLELTIRQVEPAGTPGTYRVTGRAALPEHTQVTVSAVRYLQPSNQLNSTNKPVYAILDRQLADVSQGNWETMLNLWQPNPDGEFQEAWQSNQQDLQSLEPETTVTFLVTLDPPHQPAGFRERVESQEAGLQVLLSRFTTDGELYLQAQKTITVALPTQKTAPPLPSSAASRETQQEVNIQPTVTSSSQETESPTWRKINTPLSSEDFLY